MQYPWEDLLYGPPKVVSADDIDNFDSFRAAAYKAARRRGLKASEIVRLDGDIAILGYPENVELADYLRTAIAEESVDA